MFSYFIIEHVFDYSDLLINFETYWFVSKIKHPMRLNDQVVLWDVKNKK